MGLGRGREGEEGEVEEDGGGFESQGEDFVVVVVVVVAIAVAVAVAVVFLCVNGCRFGFGFRNRFCSLALALASSSFFSLTRDFLRMCVVCGVDVVVSSEDSEVTTLSSLLFDLILDPLLLLMAATASRAFLLRSFSFHVSTRGIEQ